MAEAGYTFEISPAHIDETVEEGETALAHTTRLAEAKARAVADNLADDEDALVIGADTIVSLDGEILGKPGSKEEARAMLRRISGRVHTVITAFSIVDSAFRESTCESHETHDVTTRAVTSEVRITTLTDKEISDYVATGEPMDKAGSYAVQGAGSFMVEEVKGSYTNVVGLPMEEFGEEFREALGEKPDEKFGPPGPTEDKKGL